MTGPAAPGVLLASLLEAIPDMVFYKTTEGAYSCCNLAYAQYLGRTVDAVVGRTDAELLGPQAAARNRTIECAVMTSGRPSRSEQWVRSPDGRRVLLDAFHTPCQGPAHGTVGIIGVLRDITERRRAQDALEESEQRFRDLLERLPRIAVQGYDRERRVIFWNDANRELYGWSREEAMGRRLEDLIIPTHMREAVIEDIRRWIEEDVPIPSSELELRRKDGSTVPVYSNHVMQRNIRGEPELFCVDIDLSAQRLAEQQTLRLVYYDPLTDLPNRELVRDRVENTLAVARRAGQPVTLLYLDLDRFKNVNDSLGHYVGDRLLRQVARRLQGAVREEDTVARLGGDEFMVVLPNTPAQGAATVAEKLIGVVARACTVGGHVLSVSPSVGISVFPDNGEDFDSLTRAADTAMYRAKRRGRGGYQFFTEEMHALALRSLELESGLRRALAHGELHLAYQPQVDLAEERIIGAEALVRWQHPEWGAVPPGEFIPVAEESGLILQIGDWILDRALRQLSAWREAGLPELVLAVNLSVIQLRQEDLLTRLEALLERYRLPPRLLELEITEGIAMQEADFAVDLIRRFRDRGIGLAIDDFGTGYSSLSYLKRFRATKLKIDRSFVQDVAQDPDDAAITETIIQMGRTLGLATIAEGVETRAQLEFLRARGCAYAQGYLFGRPMAPEAFAELLLRELAPAD